MLNNKRIDKGNMMQYIQPDDLKAFGLIPELIGRLPVLTYLNPLDRDALEKILKEPKNSIIKQYQKLFEMDGVKLSFDEDALQFIIDKAVSYKLGARGLRSIVDYRTNTTVFRTEVMSPFRNTMSLIHSIERNLYRL